MKNSLFINVFCDSYYLFLLDISVRAFLPSLRVLKAIQKRDETIKILSVIRETRVVLT